MSGPEDNPAADARRLDFIESSLSHEIAVKFDEDGGKPQWAIYSMHGYPNDREWDLLGIGLSLREAIDAAIAAIQRDKADATRNAD